MTRESKLALIVGFGLVLFVGILVSDHFSAGQRQEAAHLLAQRGGARPHESPISIQSLQPAPANDVKNVRASDPHMPPVGHDDSRSETTALPGTHSRELAGNDGAGPGEIGFAPNGGRGSVERSEPPKIGPGPTPASSDSAVPTQTARDDRPAPPSTPNGQAEPAAAQVKLYPVKEGETLYSICSAHYGDAALWQALAQFNKSAVPNPARMRKGVTLRLPPIEVLKPSAAGKSASNASAPDAASGGARGESLAKRVGDAAPPRDSTSNYTVKRGETLVRIAEKTLGSSSRWEEIAKLNKDLIADPHAIEPGMVIRVPQG